MLKFCGWPHRFYADNGCTYLILLMKEKQFKILPVHRARKFSHVFGQISANSSNTTLPARKEIFQSKMTIRSYVCGYCNMGWLASKRDAMHQHKNWFYSSQLLFLKDNKEWVLLQWWWFIAKHIEAYSKKHNAYKGKNL